MMMIGLATTLAQSDDIIVVQAPTSVKVSNSAGGSSTSSWLSSASFSSAATHLGPDPEVHSKCTFTRNGYHFDLSGLQRSTDLDWEAHARDAKHKYHLNVCANTMNVPPLCKGTAHDHPSVAYQSREDPFFGGQKFCYWLGDVGHPEWALIDDENPRRGVQLTYSHGSPCGNAGGRKVAFHFLCASEFGGTSGPFEVTEFDTCSYAVIWYAILCYNMRCEARRGEARRGEARLCYARPTHHACPYRTFLGAPHSMRGWLKGCTLVFIAYLLLGTA
jgi:hypothetical protein